jgi:uncharacterized protein YcbK (DUF882 family)
MTQLRYFTEADFQGPHCNPKCSIYDLDPSFLQALDNARHHSGELARMHKRTCPYIITSAYRSPAHEAARGRANPEQRPHPSRKAVDIRFTDNTQLYFIVCGLIHAGIPRIGINYQKKFVHADQATHLPHPLIFPY